MALRYSVGIAGFAPPEQKLFEFTLGASQRREMQYELASRTVRPDLLVIESSQLVNLHSVYAAHVQHGIPVVIVGDENPAYSGERIARPIRWMRVCSTLDTQVAKIIKSVNEMHFRATAEIPIFNPPTADTDTPARNTGSAEAQAAHPSAANASRHHHVNMPPADRVLVVDDSLVVCEFLQSRLGAFNVAVDFATSGEDAIIQMGKNRYIAVFLDVVLPGADGYQVCRAIRATKSAYQPVVIMLTSKDSAFDKIRGRMVGCTTYLTKPVNEELLFKTMQKFLPAAPSASTA